MQPLNVFVPNKLSMSSSFEVMNYVEFPIGILTSRVIEGSQCVSFCKLLLHLSLVSIILVILAANHHILLVLVVCHS